MKKFDTINNIEVYEVITQINGTMPDDQGLFNPTYNWEVGEIIATNGKSYYYALNNGDMSDFSPVEESKSLEDYLSSWDSDFVDDFKKEGLL